MAKGNITLTVGFVGFLRVNLVMLCVKRYGTHLEENKKHREKCLLVCLRSLEHRGLRKEPLKSPHRNSPLPSDCTAMSLSAMQNGS